MKATVPRPSAGIVAQVEALRLAVCSQTGVLENILQTQQEILLLLREQVVAVREVNPR